MMDIRTIILAVSAVIVTACSQPKQLEAEPSFAQSFKDKFLIGTALNANQITGVDTLAVAVVKHHFNSIVAENCMKCEIIHPEENRYNFALADSLVAFGVANDMTVIGHCLIWHSQCAPWFFVDNEGEYVLPEVLKRRMKEHITTIVTRYKGQIKGWDVVNEAIVEDGSYRQSPFYEILGEEFIPLAFQYAHEADPDAELYYNDYNMNVPGRRNTVVKLIRQFKKRGLRIDAIGMQGHMGLDYPPLEEFEESILAFVDAGVKVMITEWDMSALPWANATANISDTLAYKKAMNPYPEFLPDSVSRIWNARMKTVFNLFLKHADNITRVTAWGVSDADSWKNDFPIKGRKEYPLLFDRNHQPKPFVRELVAPRKAVFDEFIYSVDSGDKDPQPFQNPILPGGYPDPSICRVGNDYYLVNSSFAYYPGVPIWHSTDLQHWTRLGYVLNRPSQLNLKSGLVMTGGIYAPDISYNPHNKLFYLITTDVNGIGNFFVTTDDPKKGVWSDPIRLPEVGGIDPSLFFGEDGKAYIVNNDGPIGDPLYGGHRAIWIREFDWQTGQTKGNQQLIINGGVDITQKPIWIEGPHLYHINGIYYLMAAEGGTGTYHSEVIFRSDNPFGPFIPCDINPILTQRHLPENRPNPVTCTGHADLVETPQGEWYAVFLAVRPYRDGHDVMGRETFMLPVKWENDQPVILPSDSVLTYAYSHVPPTSLWANNELAKDAFFIRTPQSDNYTFEDGKLSLTALNVQLGDYRHPSAIGRWVTECNFNAQTSLTFNPKTSEDLAGIIMFQNDECYIYFGKSLDTHLNPCLKLRVYCKGKLYIDKVERLNISDANNKIHLKVSGGEQVNYTFSYSFHPEKNWEQVGEPVSADLLSTRTAGGFTGTMVGIYATGNYEINKEK